MDSIQNNEPKFKADGPVMLTEEQILEMAEKLSLLRHDINGKLGIVSGYSELMVMKPDKAADYSEVVKNQVNPIIEAIGRFTNDFERVLGVVRLKNTNPPPSA